MPAQNQCGGPGIAHADLFSEAELRAVFERDPEIAALTQAERDARWAIRYPELQRRMQVIAAMPNKIFLCLPPGKEH